MYKRRNINLDKLSSYVRKTGICTEESALHLMDEIMFLRKELEVWQAAPTRHAEYARGRINGMQESAQIAGKWVAENQDNDWSITRAIVAHNIACAIRKAV